MPPLPAPPSRPPLLASLRRLVQQEDLNFLLTNRIPRRWATLFMGWFSRVELPPVPWLALRIWRLFAPDLDLSDARASRFASLHDCFTRELLPGARPVDADPAVLVSPCDAIVGACGRLAGVEAIQAKGFPYSLVDLLADERLVERHRDGLFVTLRLTSTMYHRFHAPCDGRLSEVTYISGDTWNVNPIALRRVERLFCRNERAVLPLEPDADGVALTLVPVAAILVAGIKLHALPRVLDLRYRGPNRLTVSARYRKGDELGYFQHGSTIIVFASGAVDLAPGVATGQRLRAGRPLFRRRAAAASEPSRSPAP